MEVDNKLVLSEIKETPFQHATNGERNYIICGKVILETDKNLEETKEYIEKKPWELISLITQAIAIEMIKQNKDND